MQPVISIRDLTKTYAGGFEALKSVDLDIDKGEIFGLLGRNGAGKTTLFNVIAGVHKPTSGKVTMDGEDITGLPPHDCLLRKRRCPTRVGETFVDRASHNRSRPAEQRNAGCEGARFTSTSFTKRPRRASDNTDTHHRILSQVRQTRTVVGSS